MKSFIKFIKSMKMPSLSLLSLSVHCVTRIGSLENLPCFLHEFRNTCVVCCTTIIH